jgi:hypothetical protein
MPKKDTTGAAPLPPQLKILLASIGALTETWRRWGHDIGFGIGIAHGFATLATASKADLIMPQSGPSLTSPLAFAMRPSQDKSSLVLA